MLPIRSWLCARPLVSYVLCLGLFLLLGCKKEAGAPSERQQVLSAYLNVFLPNGDDTNLWWEGGNVADCMPGRIADENLQKAFNKVLYFRHQAGFSSQNAYPIAGLYANEADKNALASVQQMALMVHANRLTTSTPLASLKCYTSVGAGSSPGFQILWENELPGLLEKSVANSINSAYFSNVRHRQWLLSPYMKKWYGGATNHAIVVYWDELSSADGLDVPEYVLWPPDGYVIDDLVSRHWSLHILRLVRDPYMPEYFAEAEVKVTTASGSKVVVDILHRDVGAHRGGVTGLTPTLVFRPAVQKPGNGDNETGETQDVTYFVEISHIQEYITRSSQRIDKINYSVTLIDGASVSGN